MSMNGKQDINEEENQAITSAVHYALRKTTEHWCSYRTTGKHVNCRCRSCCEAVAVALDLIEKEGGAR